MSCCTNNKRRNCEFGEFRALRSVRRIQLRHELIAAVIARNRKAAEKKLNDDIQQFAKEQRGVLQQSSTRTRLRVFITNTEAIKEAKTKVFLSVRKRSLSALHPPEDRKLKLRLSTNSLPDRLELFQNMRKLDVNTLSSIRQGIAVDVSLDKNLVTALSMKKSLPGLSVNDYTDDDIIDGDEIPQSVLNRGRRMSRSATDMSDLVRQELSDFVDKKNEHLPTLPEQSTKNKLSYALEVPPLSAAAKPLQRSLTSEEDADAEKRSQRRLSPELMSRSLSPRLLSGDSRISSLPSPPSVPRPPSGARPHRHQVRRPRNSLIQA